MFGDLANSGILVVEPALLDRVPPDAYWDFGHDVLPELLAAGLPVYGWPMPDGAYLVDIGSPERYRRAQVEWGASTNIK